MEICRWSHQPKANIFMDWVWDIVEQYRNNELSINTKFNDQFLSAINNINTSLNTALLSLDDRLSKLETKLASMLESILATKPDSNNVATITITNPQSNPQSNPSATNTPKILPYKYSNWKSNTFEKLKTLTNFVNSNSDQNLTLSNTMKLVFKEMGNTYNVDLSEYTFMYKCEFNLPEDDKAQALDVINYYKDLRDMLDFTLNSIMDKLNLKLTNTVTRNIFDELAERLQFTN